MSRYQQVSLFACAALIAAYPAVSKAWTAWEAGSPPGATWNYDVLDRKIWVLVPETYRFWATTGTLSTDPLDEINNLTVEFAPGVTGAVTVSIARATGQPGCTKLGQMNLNTTGVTSSTVAELRVDGPAAADGPITFGILSDGDRFNVNGAVTYPVTVTTDLSGDVTCASLSNFTATTVGGGAPIITVTNSYAGTMTINGTGGVGGIALGGLTGSVTCNPGIGSGGVTINGDVDGSIELVGISSSSNGGITITGDIKAGRTVRAHESVSPSIVVNGNLAGTLDAMGDITGSTRIVQIDGNIANGGTLYVGEVNGGPVYPSIRAGLDMLGTIEVRGRLTSTTGAPYGHIRVDGAFGADGSPATIRLVGGMSTQTPAYVCINYDGDGSCGHDLWNTGSKVWLGEVDYTGPNDGLRIHGNAASWGLGDCDGNAAVDFFDIDPFVASLGAPSATMPGLDPGRIYRADMDHDGDVDFLDIDPFVELFGATYSCGGMEMMMAGLSGENEGEPADAAVLAGILYDNTSATNRPTLLAGAEALAQTPPEGTQIDWPAVYEELTGN